MIDTAKFIKHNDDGGDSFFHVSAKDSSGIMYIYKTVLI